MEDIGLLPTDALEDAKDDKGTIEGLVPFGSNALDGSGSEGLPWFQPLVEVSQPAQRNQRLGPAFTPITQTECAIANIPDSYRVVD